MPLKTFIDRHYKLIRKFRFLYGWAKDAHASAQSSQRAAEWEKKGFKGAKLDICGGRNPYKPGEFLNVDIVKFPGVDLAFDITKPFPFEDGVIAEIFSAATLEHLRKPGNMHVLQESYRVLEPGGVLQVSTPDIEAIARAILDQSESLDFLNQYLFGKYKSDDTEIYDLHKWMFPASDMVATLQKLGFTNVEQIPVDHGLHDEKYNYLIRAEKPSAT